MNIPYSIFITIIVFVGLSTITCDNQQREFPKRFALKSIQDNLYVSYRDNEESDLLVKSKIIEEFETFESVDVPNSDEYDELFTIIAVRSAVNGKFVVVDQTEVLRVEAENQSDAEKFKIYYGSNGTIAIKSKRKNQFVNKLREINETRLACTQDFTSNFLTFELISIENEVLKIHENTQSRESNLPTKVFEHRSRFPKLFALKSKSTGHHIRVDSAEPSAIYARTNKYDDPETFEVIYFLQIGEKINDNNTVIALKSFATDKYLSVGDNDGNLAASDQLTDAEKFYVSYGAGRTISLKSIKNGKFISSSSNKNQPIGVDRDEPEFYQIIKLVDRSDFPKMFALQSVANGYFLRVDEDSSKPLKANGLNEKDNVIFEQFMALDSPKLLGENGTIIGFRSIFNGNLLSAMDTNKFSLMANSSGFTDFEKFIIYYGRNDVIGLKSKVTGKFVSAFPNQEKPIYVNRDHFKEWEMFKVVEILDKTSFPDYFSLKSMSNRNFIRVVDNETMIYANMDVNDESTVFEAILSPDSEKPIGQNEVLIGLKAYSNGKYLSAKNLNQQTLVASENSLGESEKFYVYYGLNNVIGLKAKINGKFLVADPNKNRPLYVNRRKMQEWETFEIVPF